MPHWYPTLDHAREARRHIWRKLILERRDRGIGLPANIDEIGALYIDLRIDATRVDAVIEAGGDLSVVEIGSRPEEAPDEEWTVLDDFAGYMRLVMDEAAAAAGRKTFDLSDPLDRQILGEAEARLLTRDGRINPLY